VTLAELDWIARLSSKKNLARLPVRIPAGLAWRQARIRCDKISQWRCDKYHNGQICLWSLSELGFSPIF
jgi:hypothetical protein